MEKSNNNFPKEKCGEQLLFPKEEWDSLIRWEPVSNLDPYEKAPQSVKDYHEMYTKLWLSKGGRNG